MNTGVFLRLGLCLSMAAVACACGGSSTTTTASSTAFRPALDGSGENLSGGIRGGALTVENSSDFTHIDPGQAYSLIDYEVVYATQRPLFSYLPNATETPSPDLASGPAIVSADGKTVTVHIKRGIHFSPPVNREVTSSDVAYAIERGANPNVANGYFSAYFSDIIGASKATGGGIPGIVTPDRYTIVFHLNGPYGTFFASALALPLTAPVPQEFAAPLDAKKPTAYGSSYEVATGPYMLKADAKGRFLGIGYQPGRSAVLVRNPTWSTATDRRPAYLNQIEIKIGGDPNVIGRQVLSGSHMVQNDDQVAPSIVELASRHYYNQIVAVPGAGVAYVALNNHQGPFSNANVRRAFYAALDRNAMVNAFGGPAVGQLGTHFIYPGSEGYEQAGGAAGPQFDFNRYPSGNTTLAAKYMKAAGYPSGKYTGHATVQIVGPTGSPYAELSEIVNQTLTGLGLNTKLTLLSAQAVLRFCGVPREEIDVCPIDGWIRDFADPQTILDPTFAGYNIVPEGNSNQGQVNDPQINAAMKAAERVVGTPARAQAWARIDRMLVGIAAAVPYLFNKQPWIESRDVAGINDLWNGGSWDYSYTSLK